MLDYRIIKEIYQNASHTQRSLSKMFRVSLGKINQELTTLIRKKWIRIANGRKKIDGRYIVTPSGKKQRVKLAQEYLSERLKDSDQIKRDIRELKAELKNSS